MTNEILIHWSTNDEETAKNMVLLYAGGAIKKGWFDAVTLLIWGGSQTLVAHNSDIANMVNDLMQSGVKVVACKKCAENLDIQEQLGNCGIDLFYTGEFLSNWIKSGKAFLSV